MRNTALRDRLMHSLAEIEKSALAAQARKFSEGELSVLQFIGESEKGVNPSRISDCMRLSRSRVASILSVLRRKDFISMEIDAADRRKMTVGITPAGSQFLAARRKEFFRRLDDFLSALGTEDGEALARIAEKTADILRVPEA